MSEFKILIQNEGSYSFTDVSEKTIPVTVTWEGEKIIAHFPADEWDVEELRDTEWYDLATEVASHVTTRYLYHGKKKKAEELLDWLADDPEDEHRVIVELAEQEYRIPFAVTAIRRALRPLGTDARKRVLEEVQS